MDILSLLHYAVKRHHFPDDRIFGHTNPVEILQNSDTVDQMKQYLCGCFEAFLEFSKEQTEENYANEIINKAVAFIKQHYTEALSLRDVAAYLSINSSYLCRIFKKDTGKTIVTYINDLKLAKVKMLLEQEGLSLKEIAIDMGFQNYNYFYMLFKEKFGISPSDLHKHP